MTRVETYSTVTFDGNKMQTLREGAGVQREVIAIATGRGWSTISAYEACRIQPPITVAARIADLLDVPLDALLTRRVGGTDE